MESGCLFANKFMTKYQGLEALQLIEDIADRKIRLEDIPNEKLQCNITYEDDYKLFK